MKRSILALFAVALTTAFAVPAFADADGAGAGRLAFPVQADVFKQHVEARMAKAREHMEKTIASGKLTAEQASAWRATFDAKAARVNEELGKAVADGTVTADEAKAVREVARPMGGHGGGRHGGAHCKDGAKEKGQG